MAYSGLQTGRWPEPIIATQVYMSRDDREDFCIASLTAAAGALVRTLIGGLRGALQCHCSRPRIHLAQGYRIRWSSTPEVVPLLLPRLLHFISDLSAVKIDTELGLLR